MIIDNTAHTWQTISPTVVAWLMTFAIHSTLLLGAAWLITRYLHSHRLKDLLWKAALVGGMATAAVQVFVGSPTYMPTETLDVLHKVGPVHTEETGEADTLSVAGAITGSEAGDQGFRQVYRVSDWLLGAWLAVAVAMMLRLGLVAWRFHARLGHRSSITDGPLADMFAGLCRAAGVRHGVRLTCSQGISRPVAVNGMEICLPPQAITGLEAGQQKSLLAHELAHVVRHDPAWLAVGAVLGCLFFFQPLVHVARRRMRECAEYLSDERAVRYTGDGVSLAKCLVEVSGWPRLPGPSPLVTGMAQCTSKLEERVRRLLDDSRITREERPRWWWGLLVGSLLLVVGYAGPGISVTRADAPEATPTPHVEAMVWPVEGRITQTYTEEHRALDIAEAEGTPVLAVADGVVTTAGWDDEGYGNVVVIDHGDGLSTLYAKLLDCRVEVGEEVTAGQTIGSVGSTGNSTGPHLHFEMMRDGEKINPLPFLAEEPVKVEATLTFYIDSLTWPVNGRITQPYSEEHRALDIAEAEGTPVLAATDGVVTTAGWDDEGYGNVVVIDHGDGLSTLYAKLLDCRVEVGEEVTAGQTIGSVGSTGNSTGPHLHFELIRDGERIDPTPFLKAQ